MTKLWNSLTPEGQTAVCFAVLLLEIWFLWDW